MRQNGRTTATGKSTVFEQSSSFEQQREHNRKAVRCSEHLAERHKDTFLMMDRGHGRKAVP